ncbi:MAG: acyl-CoA dehydrogenase family protein [Verrucomicrobia bacterium]|nr:acyl-CoA dehydrogenase family protein [Verrucomicrobiota bacterium]
MSDEEKQWQGRIRRLVSEEIAPRAGDTDRAATYPWENVRAMAREGPYGLLIPREYGGLQESYMVGAIAMEEIAKGCAGTAIILSAGWLGIDIIVRFGNDDQKARFLPEMVRGELQSSFCLTENQAGSDAAALETKAEARDGQYILNGTKRYAGNVEAAGCFIVAAKTSAEKRGKGITAFIVEKGTPGLSITKIHNKMGIRAAVHGDLLFENCPVPRGSVLGEVDRGLRVMLGALDPGRVFAGAMAVGIAEAAYDAAKRHAKTRVQFGRPLAENQVIQFALADMDVEIQAARLLVQQAAKALDTGQGDVAKASAACKLFASEVLQRVSDGAVQVFASFGYDLDSPVNRHYRDARSFRIMEGSSEIQRMIISRCILG